MITLTLLGCLGGHASSPTLASEPPMDPRDRYEAWLAAREPGAAYEEQTALALGAFRFYCVKTERGKRREAAASELTLVNRDGTGDWASFLTSGDAQAVAERLAWLLGTPSLLTPASPSLAYFEKSHPGLSAQLTAPSVEATGTGARLEAWYVSHPSDSVSRLEVQGSAEGATLTWTPFRP
jgi:hypothetical protein